MGKKKGRGKQAKGAAGGGGSKKNKGGKYAAMMNDENMSADNGKKKKKKTKGGNKPKHPQMTHDDELFRQTILAQKEGSFSINEMAADGNCLFRSLSDQLFGDYGNRHNVVRQNVCSFLEDNEDDFAVFLLLDEHDQDVTDFETYVGRMKEDGEWGGNVELVAAARFYRRSVTVYSPTGAFSIESGHEEESGNKLLLSYHGQDHYNSVRDENAKIKPMLLGPADDITKPKNANAGAHGQKKKNNNNKNGDLDDDVRKDDVEDGTGTPETEHSVAEDNNKQKKQQQQPQKIVRKNDPCPCGSGLRYKKCCLAVDKSKARAAKWKEKHGINGGDGTTSGEQDDDDVDETDEVVGSFKVLRI